MARELRDHKWYKTEQTPSELRFDPVSKDWVVIATGRARKPETFKQEKREILKEESCPFENLDEQEAPTVAFYEGEDVPLPPDGTPPEKWTTISILNKYPAFTPQHAFARKTRLVGPYQVMDGAGFHEVIITKHHTKDIPQFTVEEVKELVDAYQWRYLSLMGLEFVNYIAIFKNKGPAAGASVAHPHSQLIALPVTDPDIDRSMKGSKEYYEERGECVHCAMLKWDLEEGKRILFENEGFVALCPFVSRIAFEVRVYPKEHSAHFERMEEGEKVQFAQALREALKAVYAGLGDPDYNYFLHTAPADGEGHEHYHWHVEILPKTSTWAGFEIGTGIEISTIEPGMAAEFLKKQLA